MKYVKIFDSQMRPLGVLQLGAELAQSEETKYVKVYDENLDKCNGVVALSDNISEADAAKRIKIYDANLILIGGSTVGEIGGGSSEPELKLVSYDSEQVIGSKDDKIAFILVANSPFYFEFISMANVYEIKGASGISEQMLMSQPLQSLDSPNDFEYEGYSFDWSGGNYTVTPQLS